MSEKNGSTAVTSAPFGVAGTELVEVQGESLSNHQESWDEAQLSALIGLDEPKLEQAVTSVESGENVVEQADLFDEPVKSEPHDNKTKRTLSKNPYAKFGFIALGLSVVFGIGGFALTSMMSNPPKLAQKKVEPSAKKTPEVVLEKKESDEGKLKTQLALSTQAEELNKLDDKQGKRREKAKPKTNEAEPSPSPSPTQPSAINRSPVAQPPPQRVYSPPPPRMVDFGVSAQSNAEPGRSMAYNRQTEPERPLPVPALPPPPPVEPSPVPKQTQSPVTQEPNEQDQTEQWAVLASLGSYGQVVYPEQTLDETPMPVAQTPVTGQVIQAGTVVTGEIAVPVAMPEDGKGQRFVVQLSDNLPDVDGQVAIADGQFLVFEVEGVDGSGLVSAKAVSVVDEQGNERAIASAFSLESDGRPLVAQKLFDIGPDVASMDFGMVALGAISKVGEILNRPKQQSSTSTSGSSTSTSSTSTSGDPNLLGAIMEGGATPVLEAISKRNSEAIERMNDQDNAWVLSPGTRVQVRVTQPVRF